MPVYVFIGFKSSIDIDMDIDANARNQTESSTREEIRQALEKQKPARLVAGQHRPASFLISSTSSKSLPPPVALNAAVCPDSS